MAKKVPKGRCIISCIFAVFLTLSTTVFSHAKLSSLDNMDMDKVWGSAGLTIAVKNVQIFNHIDYIRYIAPGDPSYPLGHPRRCSGGYIEFEDFLMHGLDRPAVFNYDSGALTNSGLIYIDTGEVLVAPVNDWSGSTLDPSDPDNHLYRGMVGYYTENWDQELAFTIGNIKLFDPEYPTIATADPANPLELGSFGIGLIDMPRFAFYSSPPIEGIGFDFQYNFQMTIDKIEYAYNAAGDAIEFGPTYIGENFSGLSGDDPRFPGTWKPNQATPLDFGEFQLGDLFGDIYNGIYANPARINAGEADFDCSGTVLGALQLSLPMQGSIRFESAVFDSIDFGPGAIDGIQVHRLDLFLIP